MNFEKIEIKAEDSEQVQYMKRGFNHFVGLPARHPELQGEKLQKFSAFVELLRHLIGGAECISAVDSDTELALSAFTLIFIRNPFLIRKASIALTSLAIETMMD